MEMPGTTRSLGTQSLPKQKQQLRRNMEYFPRGIRFVMLSSARLRNEATIDGADMRSRGPLCGLFTPGKSSYPINLKTTYTHRSPWDLHIGVTNVNAAVLESLKKVSKAKLHPKPTYHCRSMSWIASLVGEQLFQPHLLLVRSILAAAKTYFLLTQRLLSPPMMFTICSAFPGNIKAVLRLRGVAATRHSQGSCVSKAIYIGPRFFLHLFLFIIALRFRNCAKQVGIG